MDEADEANDHIERIESASIAAIRKAAIRKAAIRKAANDIPEGESGECDLCGNWSGRLVAGVCAPCRDKYKLL